MIVLYERGRSQPVEVLRFTPDGQGLVAIGYDGVRLWKNVPLAPACQQLSAQKYMRQARVTSDGRYLLTNQNGVMTHDLTTGDSWQVKVPEEWITCFFDVTADGSKVIIAQNNQSTSGAWLACRSVTDKTQRAPLWRQTWTHYVSGPLVCLPGNRFVVSRRAWDHEMGGSFRYFTCSTETGETLAEVVGPTIAWNPTALAPDGKLLTGLHNARGVVLSTDDFSKAVATPKNDSKKHFTDIAFHPSGKYLAVTSNDKTVKLFDTTTWEVARAFTWEIGKMRSIAFSPDGTLAAAGSDKGKVVVWDVDL